MTKKIIIFSLLFFLAVSPALATEKTEKAGILPDNPLYFVKDVVNSVQTFFIFDESKKIEKLMEIAETKLNEAIALAEQQKPQVVGRVIREYEKLLNRSLELIDKAEEKGTDTSDTLVALAEDVLDQQEDILYNIESIPEKIKPIFRKAVETEKIVYNEAINSITDEENRDSIINLETEREQLDMKIEESGILEVKETKKNPDLQSDQTNTEIAPLDQNSDDPTPQIANPLGQEHGKPNMNEDGSTQVARPDGAGSCNSKMYLCQIDCGRKIIEECVHYSGTYMYQMTSCRGACMKYNIFYGCGMEAGCDEPCWQDYYANCGPDAYDNCLEDCKEKFE